jgi:hypothetical protein
METQYGSDEIDGQPSLRNQILDIYLREDRARIAHNEKLIQENPKEVLLRNQGSIANEAFLESIRLKEQVVSNIPDNVLVLMTPLEEIDIIPEGNGQDGVNIIDFQKDTIDFLTGLGKGMYRIYPSDESMILVSPGKSESFPLLIILNAIANPTKFEHSSTPRAEIILVKPPHPASLPTEN